MRVIDADVGPRDLAELGDLAEAAHPHLDDERSRSPARAGRASAAGRSRCCRLALGGDRRARAARRARARMSFVDVLPGRAGDRRRRRASLRRADERCERGERRELRRRGRASPRPRSRASSTKRDARRRARRRGRPARRRASRSAMPVIVARAPSSRPSPSAAISSSASGITRAPPQRLARDLAVVERRARARRTPGPARGPCRRSRRRRPARRARSRARSPLRRSGSISTSTPAPCSTSWMIASGSSQRGLSEVTMATSASSAATFPISGRLPRSRSPPAPKTTMHPAVAELARGAAGRSSSASGVCA